MSCHALFHLCFTLTIVEAGLDGAQLYVLQLAYDAYVARTDLGMLKNSHCNVLITTKMMQETYGTCPLPWNEYSQGNESSLN